MSQENNLYRIVFVILIFIIVLKGNNYLYENIKPLCMWLLDLRFFVVGHKK